MNYLRFYEDYIHLAISNEMENIEEFKKYLKKFNIPLGKYGTKGFKTVTHLMNEINEGETVLKEKNGELHRYVEFIGARIIYKEDGDTYRLYEDKQVFKDGRTRVRSNMPYSMAEKFKSGENIKSGIIRGLKEELGLDVKEEQFVFYNKVELDEDSDYPGIKSHHIGYEFLVILNKDQFNSDGYIEKQIDKDVFFVWKKIN